ncbi:hypothetical protein [Lutibacter citreus]|uniref:hypothetical protein n=1 Tax=Lutibacter citreus TaxID=2138210 RepID=UPI000DBEA255|nr:hypothetical protein [Lutibacter citreus]
MKNNVLFFLLFTLIVLKSFGQEVVKLNGIVKYDSIFLKDINIVNKTKVTGTSSNKMGEFNLNASLGDSIVFSSINFSKRIIVISDHHLKAKKMIVYLEDGFNELDEITLNQNIKIDVSNIYIHKNMVVDYENDVVTNRPPDMRKHVDPIGNSSNGVSILGLAFKIADELFLKKGRLKRKKEKKQLKKRTDDQDIFIKNLVTNYGENFFTNDLNIQKDKIFQFIDFCEDQGITEYYDSNEFLIKNFLVEHASKFKALKP